MEAKWSSLVSYGMSLDALQDFLPLDRTLDVKTVRYDTLKVAKRMEAELGEERSGFIEGDSRDWERLPTPEGVFTVGIDGGYVRHWLDKKHHFEVIVGKSILSFQEDEEDRTPSLKRFGFVQTYDDAKPGSIQNTCKNRSQRFYGVVTKSGFGWSGSGGVSISRM